MGIPLNNINQQFPFFMRLSVLINYSRKHKKVVLGVEARNTKIQTRCIQVLSGKQQTKKRYLVVNFLTAQINITA